MKWELPRIMVTAPASGGGKTTVTCALLGALRRRGLAPAAFKCGPDYIDPMFHREIFGTVSSNTDLFFVQENTAVCLAAQRSQGCDLAVFEGVMGYYDGVGTGACASSYHVSHALGVPALLVVDAKGAALSLAALVKGFADFRTRSQIRAVLLNRCSKQVYEMLKPVIERECGVEVVGYLPFDEGFSLLSRHLGLIPPKEVSKLKEKLVHLVSVFEQTVDLEKLLGFARNAPAVEYEPLSAPLKPEKTLRLAVAQDKAFCFYYGENLDLLKSLGVELLPFSPLCDKKLPENIDGIYLGGGYPEVFAAKLAANRSMLESIRSAVQDGVPTFAECGGFLYLHEFLCDEQGKEHRMAGLVPGRAVKGERLRHFGYITLSANRDTFFCKAGEKISAHEFHYYQSSQEGDAFTAAKSSRQISWDCIYTKYNLVAGFPHLYFYANPKFAQGFVEAMKTYAEGSEHDA